MVQKKEFEELIETIEILSDDNILNQIKISDKSIKNNNLIRLKENEDIFSI